LSERLLDPGDLTRKCRLVGSKQVLPYESRRATLLGGAPGEEHVFAGNRPGTQQPVFHLDLFLTPAGRIEKCKYAEESEGKYALLVGDPDEAAKLAPNDLVQGQLEAMGSVFQELADALERLPNVKVIRNPLPLVYTDRMERDPPERHWYFATSNNAIVQGVSDKEKKTVWLPTYGYGNWGCLDKVDARNKEIWTDLGYNVIELGDYHPLAQQGGALRCIALELGRKGL